MTLLLAGLGVCPGIAIGKARVTCNLPAEIPHHTLDEEELERQKFRYIAALTIAKRQLLSVRKQIPKDAPDDISAFIDTHILMLDDAAFSNGPIQLIYELRCNAEWALQCQRDKLVAVFNQMEDSYLRTRQDDVDHLVNRIQNILMHSFEFIPAEEEQAENPTHILVTHNLSPADLILLKAQGGVCLITEQGGPTSHSAILARSLNIPAVVSVKNACQYIRDGDNLIVDGESGVILTNLSEEFHLQFTKKRKALRKQKRVTEKIKQGACQTQDGQAITLRANMELPHDIEAAKGVGASGIGLYRTEYLYLNRPSLPDEAEQLHAYLDVVTTMAPESVTIRTMDIGNEKCPQAFQDRYTQDANPALGLRALRLCFHEPNLFRTQLKAILRASALGSVRLMLPMLSSLHEVDRVLTQIESIKQELSAQGFAYDHELPIGGMIEVPSAAIVADLFAQKLDFLSIGTNDLIQYTLAIDRGNEKLNYLYNPLNPAVLRLVERTIKAGLQHNIPVAMCGEMAGDPKYTRVLLALGLREFSVHSSNLLTIKKIIHETTLSEELLQKVGLLMNSSGLAETQNLLAELNAI